MMKFKKILMGIAALSCAAVLSAQTSNTNTSTAGVFGNDVDDFMSVNDWQGVKPENLFGYLGYAGTTLNLGAAKTFGKKDAYYVGLLVNGPLGINFKNTSSSSSSSSSSSGTGTGTTTTTTSNKEKADGQVTNNGLTYTTTNMFSVAGLFGMGDLGVKLSLDYIQPNTTKSSSSDDGTVQHKNKTGNNTVNTTLQGGYNVKVGKKYLLKNNASIAVNVKEDKTYSYDSSANPKETEADNTVVSYVLSGKSAVVFPEKNNIKQVAAAGLSAAFSTKGKVDNSTKTDAGNYTKDITTSNGVGFVLTPSYKVVYTGVKNLNVGATVAVPVSLDFANSKTVYDRETSNAAGTYKTSNNTLTKVTKTDFIIQNTNLSLGMQYAVVPEKFTINAGASLGLPSFYSTNTVTKMKDNYKTVNNNNEAIVDTVSKDSSSYTRGYVSSTNFTFSSGFACVLAKTITFDCTYNVLGDLLSGNMVSRWNTGTANVWDNVNLVLFHTLDLGLSIKL